MKHMHVLLPMTLAMSLVLIALAPRAHAQAQQKTAPVATTPASKAKEPAQETPRAMLERAAFLEEHERDFEGAARLYEQAAAAAQAAGDAKTAAEAQAARAHVLARIGKEIPPVALSVQVSGDDAISNRIDQLFGELAETDGYDRYAGILADLEQFGARVVPLAEQALSGRLTTKSFTVQIKTIKLAQLLAGIGGPEAMQALARALDSPDPVIRRDVTSALNAEKHRTLLEKAAADASPGVRGAAIQRLRTIGDPSLASIMERAAKDKNDLAVQWLAAYEPQKLIDLAFDSGADDGLRLMAVRSLRNARSIPADVRLARGMLQVCLTASDESVRRNMPGEIASLFNGPWLGVPRAFRRDVEGLVLDHFSELGLSNALDILKPAGGVQTFVRVAEMYADKVMELNSNEAQRIAGALDLIQARLVLGDFDALVASYKRWHAPQGSSQARESYNYLVGAYVRALLTIAKQKVPVDSIIKGWEGLDDPQQAEYLRAVSAWIQSSWDSAANRFVPGTTDARMLPLVRADLAQSIEKNYDAAWVVTYAMALGDVASIPVVLAIERKYPHTEYAARAVDVLLQRDPQHARKAIEDAIALGWENPTSATRSQAADLAYLSAADAISLFERLWPRASTSAARHELFAMLVHFPDRDATPIVFKHYPELDSNDLRGAAIERFGNELYEPAIPLLGDALKSSSDYVRNSARDAFKKFKDYREALEEFSAWMNADKDSRASIAELSKLLESNNRDVVIGAVHSLAAVKARSALPALVKLLERPDPELKKAVEEAIARIGGG